MKNFLLIILSTALLSSCDDNVRPIGRDTGCIELVRTLSTDHLVSADTVLMIKKLFEKNHVSMQKLRFTRFEVGDTAYYKKSLIYVDAQQYINEYPVFTSYLVFAFTDSIVSLPEVMGLPALPFTVKKLDLPQVRWLYADAASKNLPPINLNGVCLEAEFGYFNVNAGTSFNTPSIQTAWFVHPKGAIYPIAYILDKGSVFNFWDGTIIN